MLKFSFLLSLSLVSLVGGVEASECIKVRKYETVDGNLVVTVMTVCEVAK